MQRTKKIQIEKLSTLHKNKEVLFKNLIIMIFFIWRNNSANELAMNKSGLAGIQNITVNINELIFKLDFVSQTNLIPKSVLLTEYEKSIIRQNKTSFILSSTKRIFLNKRLRSCRILIIVVHWIQRLNLIDENLFSNARTSSQRILEFFRIQEDLHEL